MTARKILPLILAIVLKTFPAFADWVEENETLRAAKAKIEQAYYTDNKKELRSQIKHLKPLISKKGAAWYAHYYLAFCHNHLAMLYLTQDEDRSQKHVDAAFDHVDQAMELRENAELYVLSTSLQGKKITLGSSFLRMTRGLEALQFVTKAKELDPNMPGVIFEDALTEYHTPPEFGGGIDKAIDLLKKNLTVLETYQHKDPLFIDWHLKEDNLAWLAYLEAESGNTAQASDYLKQAQAIRPDHAFVQKVVSKKVEEKKNELLRTKQNEEKSHG